MRFALFSFLLMVHLTAGAQPVELPAPLYQRISELAEVGNRLAEDGQYQDAVAKYVEGLQLLPEPITDWDACTWLLVSIGDAHFLAGNHEQARVALTDAMHCPDAIGNPFIHLRLGQTQFELGHLDQAADELARAFMLEGLTVFEEEDPKYLAFLRTRLKAPPGGWPADW